MAYTVLARKYRSQTFDDVIGQDAISKTLKNAIKTGRIAHAFLFVGTRGVGKTTMARILAKALNCQSAEGPTSEPCCKCESCVAINLGEDIDVVEIDGASNRGIDSVRELRQNAIYRPARSRFKIYIIDEVHMLTTEAFNALLKTLEEPPSHVKFIFATTEPNKVIPTIQSRCQRFDFSNISVKLIAEQLKRILEQEKIGYEDDLILSVAKMANGSMRDGLSLLDRLISTGEDPLRVSLLEEFLGCPNNEKMYELIGRIGDSDAAGTLAAVEDLSISGLSEVQIVDGLVDYMRDLMLVKAAGAQSELVILTSEQRRRADELAEKFDIAAIIYIISALEKVRWALKSSETARALLEALLLRFALSEHFLNVDEIVSRMKGAGGGAIKKNEIVKGSERRRVTDEAVKPKSGALIALPVLRDIDLLKTHWQEVLGVIASELGNGTAGLLKAAKPRRFEDGQLTLTFPVSAQIHKKMCESNGRVEQLESLLGEYCQVPVKVKLEVEANGSTSQEPLAEAPGINSRKKNEILNDPAVKTILTGLEARITGIEEIR